MDTSRDDIGIAIRSAFLNKGTKQRFSLFVLIIISIVLIFFDKIETKPFSIFRSIVKDTIYRGALIANTPSKIIKNSNNYIQRHISVYGDYIKLKKENDKLKNKALKIDFLELENTQLRKLIEEEAQSLSSLLSARVMLDKQSPYLNSFVINIGSNKKLKNGMAVLHGKNFVGRIVDVNFFSSRVLLVSDLNSKIPIITEPSANHAILSGHGINKATLDYLSENHNIQDGDKVYTSGKEGLFTPGIPIGVVKKKKDLINVELFSDLSQITFVNIKIEENENK
jgi:rod shape-determining protein MreC|tara:strand:+ start:133 stop:978 length:846 start_codon:yes stop_codon:yes gene_type:complete